MTLRSNYFQKIAPAPGAFPAGSLYDFLHQGLGYVESKSIAIAGTGAEVLTNCFQITGLVELKGLWGVWTDVTEVTTMTGCYWDLYDGANSVALCTGVACSGASLGATVAKLADDASAATFLDADQTRYGENSSVRQAFFGGLMLQKAATNTYIRFRVTTDANTDCDIRMWAAWAARDTGSLLEAV